MELHLDVERVELDAVNCAMDYLISWWQGSNPDAPPLLRLRMLEIELMRAQKVVRAEMWAKVAEVKHDSNKPVEG